MKNGHFGIFLERAVSSLGSLASLF